MLPLPAHRARNPAYFYPTVEAARARVEKSHKQQRRLDARKTRLSELEVEIAEAKAEVDSACADARSAELRKQYGPETLRNARETAKKALSALVLERKTLVSSVAEAERKVKIHFYSKTFFVCSVFRCIMGGAHVFRERCIGDVTRSRIWMRITLFVRGGEGGKGYGL